MCRIRHGASRDFNRLVWQQTSKLPNLSQDVVQHLHTPLVAVEQTEDRATLVLGDDKFGAHVTLVRESGQFVVDDVMLISGTMPRDHVELKRVLRMHIATFGVGKSYQLTLGLFAKNMTAGASNTSLSTFAPSRSAASTASVPPRLDPMRVTDARSATSISCAS